MTGRPGFGGTWQSRAAASAAHRGVRYGNRRGKPVNGLKPAKGQRHYDTGATLLVFLIGLPMIFLWVWAGRPEPGDKYPDCHATNPQYSVRDKCYDWSRDEVNTFGDWRAAHVYG